MKKILILITVYICIGSVIPLLGVSAETIKIAAIFAKSGDAQIDNLYNFQGIVFAFYIFSNLFNSCSSYLSFKFHWFKFFNIFNHAACYYRNIVTRE